MERTGKFTQGWLACSAAASGTAPVFLRSYKRITTRLSNAALSVKPREPQNAGFHKSLHWKVHGSMFIQLNIRNNHDCHPLWYRHTRKQPMRREVPILGCLVQAKDAPTTNSLSSHHETTSKQSPAKKGLDRRPTTSMQADLSPYSTDENMSQLDAKPTLVVKEQTWPVLHHTDKIQRPKKAAFHESRCHCTRATLGKCSLQWEHSAGDYAPGQRKCGPPFPKQTLSR